MDDRNDWKRVTESVTPSRSGRYGNERHESKDVRKKYSNNYRGPGSENYGNRMGDPNNDYLTADNSGFIDLDSAVDTSYERKKRKRISKEVEQTPIQKTMPYKKVVLKKKGYKPELNYSKKTKPQAPEYPDIVFDKPVRLNRLIANTGLCSRREADIHIKEGTIKVNGEVITELGVKVNQTDEISFKDQVLTNQRKIYLLLNKPKGFVTSLEEPDGKKLVIDLVRGACKERIYPVGRLDKMTTGVLLFTNDGDLSLKLTHPSNRMRKVYQVTIDKPITEEDMQKLALGIELEDGPMAFDSIAYSDYETKNMIGVEVHSGRNRIVRRMFEAVGYKVIKLDRVYFAGLTRKGLKRGKWRFLSPEEVAFLKMMPS